MTSSFLSLAASIGSCACRTRLSRGTCRLAVAMVLGVSSLGAQQGRAPSLGDTSIFAPLQLAAPNELRNADGAPGARYWQNRADYSINATLDTAAKVLTASMQLRYTNHSPDTLRFIWLQTEQNAFRPQSLSALIEGDAFEPIADAAKSGYVIDRFDQLLPAGKEASRRTPLVRRDNETLMKVNLAQPLAPGATATFDVAWHFKIPELGALRMGRDGSLYELAQWYPRLVVYDDVRGWNVDPYMGWGEFYLEYGDFKLALTVPAGYLVAATGVLQNAQEVLTPVQRERFAEAARSEHTVHIVRAEELARGVGRPSASGSRTWKFFAHNVRDAVWAASPDYLWDATSWHGVMANAYYRPRAAQSWFDAADQARMSIMEYSERWFPYPYPQISAIEGPAQGMEYPMVAMEGQSDDVFGLYGVVTHEIGHMWFPMIVGSNERLYAWQDEGINTFINTFSEARRYPLKGDQLARAAKQRQRIEDGMKQGAAMLASLNPDRMGMRELTLAGYVKPSVALQLLRQEILGPEVFDEAFRTYIQRWAFRHPTPTDFFRTMESVSGRKLDWFWREWFFEDTRFDQAIDSVQSHNAGDTTRVTIVYGNHQRGVLPIHVRLTLSDGSTQDHRYPAEVWSTNTSRYAREYVFIGKRLTKVELDPDQILVDIDRTNNVWGSGVPIQASPQKE